MSDWQEVKLRECISTLKGFAFKSKWYQPDGIPIVRVSDFTDNSISVDDIEYIPHDLAQEHSRYLLKTKDVIVQTVGSWQHNPVSIVGKVVNVPSNLNGALLNQNAVKIIPNKTIDNNFLYYRLKDEHFKLHNLGCAQGAANQASITLSSIGSFRFNLPPLPTQQKIAKILSNYDDLIENNLKRIKLLEESARLTYEEWFLRFCIDGKKLDIDPETKLPFGWQDVLLTDYIDLLRGVEPGSSKYEEVKTDSNIPFIRVGDLSKRDSDIYVSKDLANNKIIDKDDILLSLDGSPGKVRFGLSGCYSTGIRKAVSKQKNVSSIFIYNLLNSPYIQGLIEAYATGATILHAGSSVKKMRLVLPTDEVLDKYNNIEMKKFQLILNLSDEIKLLKEARDILLPRLMTGMIDTDDMDIAV